MNNMVFGKAFEIIKRYEDRQEGDMQSKWKKSIPQQKQRVLDNMEMGLSPVFLCVYNGDTILNSTVIDCKYPYDAICNTANDKVITLLSEDGWFQCTYQKYGHLAIDATNSGIADWRVIQSMLGYLTYVANTKKGIDISVIVERELNWVGTVYNITYEKTSDNEKTIYTVSLGEFEIFKAVLINKNKLQPVGLNRKAIENYNKNRIAGAGMDEELAKAVSAYMPCTEDILQIYYKLKNGCKEQELKGNEVDISIYDITTNGHKPDRYRYCIKLKDKNNGKEIFAFTANKIRGKLHLCMIYEIRCNAHILRYKPEISLFNGSAIDNSSILPGLVF